MHASFDEALAVLASHQHGLFTRDQAISAGATPANIATRLRSSVWRHGPVRGIYSFPGAVETWERRLMTAVLDAGAGSVVSHRAAAALHELEGFRKGPPEISAPRPSWSARPWRVHRPKDLHPADMTRIRFVPTTTVCRTLIDLASDTPSAKLARTIDNALAARRVEIDELADRFADLRRSGKPGVRRLHVLLLERASGTPIAESKLERQLLKVLRTAGFPEPDWQFPFPSDAISGRVDAAYPASRLIIEADGRRWHTRVDDFERDRQRDIEAGLRGWTVVRFTWRDLTTRTSWVEDVVRHHLEADARFSA